MASEMVENCGNCAFGVKHYLHQGSELRCQRHAPLHVEGGDVVWRKTLWPKVDCYDFCGDFELKDAK